MKTGSDFENGQRIGKKIANRIWRSVTSEYLEKLYESMPKRMLAVIEAHPYSSSIKVGYYLLSSLQ